VPPPPRRRPELFPDLVPLGLARSLSFLLIHDNADRTGATAFLLIDLNDSNDPFDLAGV
jgi:beta-catenin-like protein 1